MIYTQHFINYSLMISPLFSGSDEACWMKSITHHEVSTSAVIRTYITWKPQVSDI